MTSLDDVVLNVFPELDFNCLNSVEEFEKLNHQSDLWRLKKNHEQTLFFVKGLNGDKLPFIDNFYTLRPSKYEQYDLEDVRKFLCEPPQSNSIFQALYDSSTTINRTINKFGILRIHVSSESPQLWLFLDLFKQKLLCRIFKIIELNFMYIPKSIVCEASQFNRVLIYGIEPDREKVKFSSEYSIVDDEIKYSAKPRDLSILSKILIKYRSWSDWLKSGLDGKHDTKRAKYCRNNCVYCFLKKLNMFSDQDDEKYSTYSDFAIPCFNETTMHNNISRSFIITDESSDTDDFFEKMKGGYVLDFKIGVKSKYFDYFFIHYLIRILLTLALDCPNSSKAAEVIKLLNYIFKRQNVRFLENVSCEILEFVTKKKIDYVNEYVSEVYFIYHQVVSNKSFVNTKFKYIQKMKVCNDDVDIKLKPTSCRIFPKESPHVTDVGGNVRKINIGSNNFLKENLPLGVEDTKYCAYPLLLQWCKPIFKKFTESFPSIKHFSIFGDALITIMGGMDPTEVDVFVAECESEEDFLRDLNSWIERGGEVFVKQQHTFEFSFVCELPNTKKVTIYMIVDPKNVPHLEYDRDMLETYISSKEQDVLYVNSKVLEMLTTGHFSMNKIDYASIYKAKKFIDKGIEPTLYYGKYDIFTNQSLNFNLPTNFNPPNTKYFKYYGVDKVGESVQEERIRQNII